MALPRAAPLRHFGVLCSLPLLVDGVAPQLHRQRTSSFSRFDYRASHVKHMVVYGSTRTGDYLIVAII